MNGVTNRAVPFIFKEGLIRGYIFVPEEYEREKFIEECLRKERFSVVIDPVGVLHNCEITKSALRDIVFPKEGEKIGSAVVLMGDKTGKAIITGVVSKQGMESFKKDNIYTIKMGDDDYAAISVDSFGNIQIDVLGSGSNGNFILNVNNRSHENKISINTTGSIELNCFGNTIINSEVGDFVVNTINSKVTTKRFELNGGLYSMVLGDLIQAEINKSNEVLKAIHDAITEWTPIGTVGDGASFKTLLSSKLAGLAEGNFDEILSTKAFLE